jgi:hypothetical protein
MRLDHDADPDAIAPIACRVLIHAGEGEKQ